MSTVGPDYREPIDLGVLLDLITNVTVLLTRTNCGQETKSNDKQYCSPAKYLLFTSLFRGKLKMVRDECKIMDISLFSDVTMILTYGYSLHHALIRRLHQLTTVIVDLTNEKGLVQITMETTMVDSYVN